MGSLEKLTTDYDLLTTIYTECIKGGLNGAASGFALAGVTGGMITSPAGAVAGWFAGYGYTGYKAVLDYHGTRDDWYMSLLKF